MEQKQGKPLYFVVVVPAGGARGRMSLHSSPRRVCARGSRGQELLAVVPSPSDSGRVVGALAVRLSVISWGFIDQRSVRYSTQVGIVNESPRWHPSEQLRNAAPSGWNATRARRFAVISVSHLRFFVFITCSPILAVFDSHTVKRR